MLVSLGACPICSRDMIKDGFSVDEHHFIPKSRGGKEKTFLHKVCHRWIHSQWTEKELANTYNHPEIIIQTEQAQKFLSFIRKKDPQFFDRSISSNTKKK